MTTLGRVVIPIALVVIALGIVTTLHWIADVLGVPRLALSMLLWAVTLVVLGGGSSHDGDVL